MKTGVRTPDAAKTKPAVIRAVNKVIQSPAGVFILAALTALSYAFSLEFYFYLFVICYAIYVAACSDDLSPLMPLFIFCYIAPSAENNPGKSEGSIFYGTQGAILLASVSVAVILVFVRIARDKNMGFKRLFTKHRMLAPGMLLLGIAYVLSGITSTHHAEYALRNLCFALIQFASVFLLYFVFTATVRYDKFKISYLASIGVMMGFIVTFELIMIYLGGGVLADGAIVRRNIFTGWGIYNNLGVIIVMSIPFAFYFLSRARFTVLWLVVGTALFAAAWLTCSRAAWLFSIPIFIISYAAALKKSNHKAQIITASAILLAGAAAAAFIFKDILAEAFESIPRIFSLEDGVLAFNDSARVKLYKDGIEAFKSSPIFGISFYPVDFHIYDFSEIEAFSSFFPPRWHNTVIQLLASCGILGIIAYAIHRISTVVLFVKRKSRANTFIAISIIALLVMSLVDCHFFNVGPVLFYSIMLAVMECAKIDEN